MGPAGLLGHPPAAEAERPRSASGAIIRSPASPALVVVAEASGYESRVVDDDVLAGQADHPLDERLAAVAGEGRPEDDHLASSDPDQAGSDPVREQELARPQGGGHARVLDHEWCGEDAERRQDDAGHDEMTKKSRAGTPDMSDPLELRAGRIEGLGRHGGSFANGTASVQEASRWPRCTRLAVPSGATGQPVPEPPGWPPGRRQRYNDATTLLPGHIFHPFRRSQTSTGAQAIVISCVLAPRTLSRNRRLISQNRLPRACGKKRLGTVVERHFSRASRQRV